MTEQITPAVLITDNVHSNLLNGLRTLGYRFTYAPEITVDQALSVVESYAGIVINTKTPADRTLLDAGINLRFVARLGSGLEIVDLDLAECKGIRVFRAAEANANAVAEHCFGMLLSLIRNLAPARREMQNMRFEREKNRGVELEGKIVGVIGFGNSGSRFARKFQGWKVQVLAYDKYLTDFVKEETYIEETSLGDLLTRSDVVSLHVPLTEETKYMVDQAFLEKMKQGAILINSSRGNIVDTAALKQALNTSQLAGACLDVFENEKPEDYTEEERGMYAGLFLRDNVMISPHIAGWTKESKRKLADILLEKISSL